MNGASEQLGLKKKKYQCDECDSIYLNQCSLKIHMKAKHEGIRYPCDQCEFTASTSIGLRKHKESKHEGIRYPCE